MPAAQGDGSSTGRALAPASAYLRANGWTCYWMRQQWHHYDLISTCSSMFMMTANVLRATASSSSSESPKLLRATQVAVAAALGLHILALWLMLRQPARYFQLRHMLTCARWLLVGALIVASTPLPVFQAGHTTSSRWWLLRSLGFGFRTGLLFCAMGFIFYRMPCELMAVIGFIYAATSIFTSSGYCRSVIKVYGSPQPHADFQSIQDAAVVLDFLIGHGQLQQHQELELGSALRPEDAAEWQSTASLLLLSCNSTVGAQLQQDCKKALLGQCRAVVITLHLALTYLLWLGVVTLERFSKWRFLQQHQQQQHQQGIQQVQSEQFGATSTVTSSSNSSSSSDRSPGLLTDPYMAPTAGTFLRLELLKLVVLADVPVLLLWWALASLLRSPLSPQSA